MNFLYLSSRCPWEIWGWLFYQHSRNVSKQGHIVSCVATTGLFYSNGTCYPCLTHVESVYVLMNSLWKKKPYNISFHEVERGLICIENNTLHSDNHAICQRAIYPLGYSDEKWRGQLSFSVAVQRERERGLCFVSQMLI